MITKHEFKIVGKPLHPNKRPAVFELCEKFVQNQFQPVEDEDWKVLKEEDGIIELRNKNTLEYFTCKIIYIHS